ncbi:hypothetical protein N8370_04450 [Amylibacter sp.]|nr:hypothetical protein [Amylibacter sp.]
MYSHANGALLNKLNKVNLSEFVAFCNCGVIDLLSCCASISLIKFSLDEAVLLKFRSLNFGKFLLALAIFTATISKKSDNWRLIALHLFVIIPRIIRVTLS